MTAAISLSVSPSECRNTSTARCFAGSCRSAAISRWRSSTTAAPSGTLPGAGSATACSRRTGRRQKDVEALTSMRRT